MKKNVNFTVNKAKCIKCGICATDCFFELIKMNDYPEIAEDAENSCIRCQHCYAICPTGAISILDNSFDEKVYNYEVDYNEIKNLILMRRSTRQYKDENIDKSIILDLCKTALHSPTAKNLMNRHITVVDDKEILDKIKKTVYEKLCRIEIDEKFVIIKHVVEIWAKTGKDKLFSGAPHLLVVSEPEDALFKTVDGLIALSYFEILANAQGIGTLWNGLLTVIFNQILPELKKELQIPKHNKIVYSMLFGIPSIKYHRPAQKDFTTDINFVSRGGE